MFHHKLFAPPSWNTGAKLLPRMRAGTAVLLALFTAAPAAAGEALLADLRLQHKSNIESVHTLRCKIRVYDGDKSKESVSGEFFKSANAFRIKQFNPDGMTQELLTKGQSTLSVTTGTKGTLGASKGPATHPGSRCDVWFMMGLDFPGPSKLKGTIDEFLQLAEKNHATVKEAAAGGGRYYVVNFTFDDRDWGRKEVEAWFDRGANCLLTKMTYTGEVQSKKIVNEEQVETTEVEPGIFFPVKSRSVNYRDGAITSKIVAVLSDLSINTPIPDATMQLPIPAGSQFVDVAAGKTYVADAKGNPIGPSEPLITKMPAILKSEPAGKQTQGQVTSWWLILFLVSALLLLVVGGITFYRWRTGQGEAR